MKVVFKCESCRAEFILDDGFATRPSDRLERFNMEARTPSTIVVKGMCDNCRPVPKSD